MTENIYPRLAHELPPLLHTPKEAYNEKLLEQKLKERYEFTDSIHNINDVRKYFEHEIKKYRNKNKKLKIVNYLTMISEIVISLCGAGGGIALCATGVGAAAGLPIMISSVVSIGVLMKISDHIFNSKRRKYTRITMLARNTLSEFDRLFRKAMMDQVIDEKEYATLTAKYEFYKNNKNKIKEDTKITGEQIYNLLGDKVPEDLKEKITNAVINSLGGDTKNEAKK